MPVMIRSLANVGWLNNAQDIARMATVFTWLLSHGFDDEGCVQDDIDLQHGRDFLAEEREYDVVVLHHLYADPLGLYSASGQLGLSPHHAAEKWRNRLMDTKARAILAFGFSSEIAGAYLGEISGYRMTAEEWGTAYIRIDSAS